MMIVPMKVQEIDNVAYPHPIHQVSRSSAEEKGESQGMEGIIVPDLSVNEEDSANGNPGNNNEKGGS